MLTEQEALAVLNEKLSSGGVKETTTRYMNKLAAMEKIIKSHQTLLDEKQSEIKLLEKEIQRARGATSILVELAAEEEGLIP